MNITPIGDRLLVKLIEDEAKTHGEFAVAEGARKDKPMRGQVISRGDKCTIVAEKVLFASYGYDEVGEYLLVPGDLVLASIEE